MTISGASLSGAGASAFKVEQDACAGLELEFMQLCPITLDFTPPRAGAFSAQLTLADNELTPSSVTLSGTGVPAGAGPTGVAGPAGPAGPQGPAGKIELVRCRTITKRVKKHGHRRKVRTQKCTAKLVSGPVKFTATGSKVHATLVRAGVIYATGTSASLRRARERLLLSDRRPLPSGRYTLLLRWREHGRLVARRERVTVG